MLIDNPKISNLYGYRFYVNPQYGEWENWFAWHPIWMNKWTLFSDINNTYMKVRKLYWLTYVVRRQVVDQFERHYWEYTTTEDLLRYG